MIWNSIQCLSVKPIVWRCYWGASHSQSRSSWLSVIGFRTRTWSKEMLKSMCSDLSDLTKVKARRKEIVRGTSSDQRQSCELDLEIWAFLLHLYFQHSLLPVLDKEQTIFLMTWCSILTLASRRAEVPQPLLEMFFNSCPTFISLLNGW